MTTPRVDFYVLEAEGAEQRLRFACRLAEKAYGLQNRVHAWMDSDSAAESFNELLWTFRQGSFVPHERVTADSATPAPVTIGTTAGAPQEANLLINLSEGTPDLNGLAGNVERIAEIVAGDASSRAAGRERFKFYRDQGLTPETHKISA